MNTSIKYTFPLVGGTLITTLVVLVANTNNWEFSTMEMLAVWTSFICTLLCVTQSRWNYPVGILSTSLLAYVFFDNNLLGSALLNIYLIPTLVYGWFVWGKDDQTRPVEWLKWKDPIVVATYLAVTVLVYIGATQILKKFGGSVAGLDSIILCGSILAQFLLDRKKIETWFVWAAVNVVSIYLYFSSELYLLGMQFVLFLVNTVFGGVMWYKSMSKN